MSQEINIDALLPQEMAEKAEEIGVRKAAMPFFSLFTLSVLAGAFIALGAMFAIITAAGSAGEAALNIASSKVGLGFVQAVMLGVLGNVLVCLAVWLSFSARSTTDKILAIIFPITAFVAASFEHSIANMYFIPYAILIKSFDPAFVISLAEKAPDLSRLTWSGFFLNNLLPVTIGNIIGGAGLVAVTYWFVYLSKKKN